jgi:hypothetical protein
MAGATGSAGATGGSGGGAGGASGASGGTGTSGIVRDQYNPSDGGTIGLEAGQRLGQSFTVGLAGRLRGIVIPMFRFQAAVPGDIITLSLFTCSAIDACGSTAVATATIATDSLAGNFSSFIPEFMGPGYFDLTASNVQVSPAQIYRVRLDVPAQKTFGALDSSGDTYPNGVAFQQFSTSGPPVVLDRSLDLAFATYVSQ